MKRSLYALVLILLVIRLGAQDANNQNQNTDPVAPTSNGGNTSTSLSTQVVPLDGTVSQTPPQSPATSPTSPIVRNNAATRGDATNQADVDASSPEINSKLSDLSTVTAGAWSAIGVPIDGSELKTEMSLRNLQSIEELKARVSRVYGNAGGFLSLPGVGDYTIMGSADMKPFNETNYPTYPESMEMQEYGQQLTASVNEKIQKAKNWLNKKKGLGGCGAYDWAIEFAAMCNRETLKNMWVNMREAIIAAAPMAILQAISPELASLVEHLKAMAMAALQMQNMSCQQVQAVMTQSMGKMFNGSKWNDCVEAAQKQGKSYDVASRMCNSQKETSDDPVLGGLQVGVQSVGKFGSDVDAFLTEGAMYVNGSSWGDAEAAVVNSRQNNAVASEALVKMPQMATVLADKTTDLLGVCPGCVQKTDSEWPAIISKISNQTDRETAEQYYQQYLFFKGEWQRAKGQVANAGRESPADLMQYSTSRAASTALGNDIMQYVQTNAGGLTGDLKSAIEAETGLTGADALRANNANPLGSTVNWLRDGAVDMAKGFIGTMQITPTMNVGLEIGRYSYKFNLIKLKHNSFQIMTDLESGMGNVMPLWTNCATDDLERQFTIIEVYLYHFASEKWKDIPDIKKYLVNADGDTKLTRTTIIKASQFFDDILVGTPAQRRAALDRQITNGKGGRSMTIREITEKLAHGSVCAYAAEGLNGQKVNEYFTKLETFGSKLPGDERKRIADAIANAKDSIATTCGKGITDALAAISILNAQKLPPRYCGSGSAPASTITIPQNADGYRYEYTVSP